MDVMAQTAMNCKKWEKWETIALGSPPSPISLKSLAKKTRPPPIQLRHFTADEIPEPYVPHPVPAMKGYDAEREAEMCNNRSLGEMRVEGRSAVKRLWEMMKWVFDDEEGWEDNEDGDWV